jgi:hypothetical protein
VRRTPRGGSGTGHGWIAQAELMKGTKKTKKKNKNWSNDPHRRGSLLMSNWGLDHQRKDEYWQVQSSEYEWFPVHKYRKGSGEDDTIYHKYVCIMEQ